MASWAVIKFFWDTMLGAAGSTLAATSTASGYSVNSIYNMLEVNSWLSGGTTSPQYITYDAGASNTATADYLAISGHNLNTIGATIVLQYSTDNFAADVNDAFTPFAPSADTVILKEFTAPAGKRYWRLKISGTISAAPRLDICIWGEKTELDYVTGSLDPHAYEEQANVNVSYGGYVSDVTIHHIERRMTLQFEDCDSTLYAKLAAWYDSHGLRNFFVAWETANNPDEVYLMRREGGRSNPLTHGGAYRSVNIALRGRKE